MPRRAARLSSFRARVALILGFLSVANLVAWAGALGIVSAFPLLIGSAALAYGLGWRHAFDADHIAAIDNVTRRLVAAGVRPAGVGFFFSLGHSSVVLAATIAVAITASRFRENLFYLQDRLGPLSTIVSSLFLLIIAALNVLVFIGVWRALRQSEVRSNLGVIDEAPPQHSGAFSAVARPPRGRR